MREMVGRRALASGAGFGLEPVDEVEDVVEPAARAAGGAIPSGNTATAYPPTPRACVNLLIALCGKNAMREKPGRIGKLAKRRAFGKAAFARA